MAKKSRMGRNLNALLGGASRTRDVESERTPASGSESTESVAADDDSTNRIGSANTGRVETEHAGKSAPESAETTSASNSIASDSIAPNSNAPNSNAPKNAPDDAPKQPSQPSTISSANSSAAQSPANDKASTSTLVNNTDTQKDQQSADAHPSDRLRMLGVDQITRGMYQPRRHFDQDLLQELADSIKAQGLIQPILVRAYAGKFELIAGERRWRASQLAGITDIPAIVRDMDDQSVAAVSLIENIQRADLNPLEEAQALERLCGEFSMTHQQVAEAVGRSRVAVTNLMRLLELHADVKSMVDNGELDMGHARALLGAPQSDQPDRVASLLKLIRTSTRWVLSSVRFWGRL